MLCKAIVFPSPFQVDLKEIDCPVPGPGEVVSKTIYSGVSTGTETRVLSGNESPVFPLIPGYENIGVVVETGSRTTIPKGTHIYTSSTKNCGTYSRLWGGHVEYTLQDESDIIVLPDGINLLDTSFAHTAAIAYHGVRRGAVKQGDTVAIVGQGLIGFLAALCAKALGATVIAIDTIDERLEAVKSAGIDYVINSAKTDMQIEVKKITQTGVDVAIDATGISSIVDKTGRLIKERPWTPPFPENGKLVILGSYKDPIAFSYHPTLFENEIDIYTSRDCTTQDIRDVIQLIADKKLQPSLIPHAVFSPKDCMQAYKELMDKKHIRIIFQWRDS